MEPLPQYQRRRNWVFFSEREVERELKMALRDTLTCGSAVCTLIDNSKLANQIARLVAIVVKMLFLVCI